MDENIKRGVELFGDLRWRLNNLYYIQDETGARVKFQMNWAQEELFKDLWYNNLILKARQLGFSTFIQVFFLDTCLFNSGMSAGTIAHTRVAAEDIFNKKIKYAYNNLPEGLRDARPAVEDSARRLSFNNESDITVGTSLRSGTYQRLHISEYGKLCAQWPEKAREVRTGALNTIHAGQMAFIESTAEGQEGHFFELCQKAQEKQRRGLDLSPLDFKFFFFPWWKEERYQLNLVGEIPADKQEYFEELESKGISLTPQQKAWYVAKAEMQQEDMFREFPSTAEEAFKASVEGAYYAKQFVKLDKQGRIGNVPPHPSLGTETWWDLGLGDLMSIWWVQRDGAEYRVINYYQSSGEGLEHYAKKLAEVQEELDLTYTGHLWPHDGNVRILDEKGRQRTEVMRGLGYDPEVQQRGLIQTGIEAVRGILPLCRFDAERCSEGLRGLRNYRKDWDENNSTWKKTPRHDENSHPADAFRTGAMKTTGRDSSKSRQSGRRAPDLAIV